jgi:hypothetical protein
MEEDNSFCFFCMSILADDLGEEHVLGQKRTDQQQHGNKH